MTTKYFKDFIEEDPIFALSEAAKLGDGDKARLDNIEDNATADMTGAEIKAAYEGESDTNAFTDAEKLKLGNLTEGFLGYFGTSEALAIAHPVGAAGKYAVVGSTDTLWAWDVGSTAWVNTDTNSLGDMLKSVYDPAGKNASAFLMANMTEGADSKIMTAAERTRLAAPVNLASGDVSGNLPVSKLGSGVGAEGSTFWRGDGVWAVPAMEGVVDREVLVPASREITALECSAGAFNNYGQAAVDALGYLPVAAQGMKLQVAIGAARAGNFWGLKAKGLSKIYLDGVAGVAGGAVITTPVVGAQMEMLAVKTAPAVYDWLAHTKQGVFAAAASFSAINEDGNNSINEDGNNTILE